MTNVGGTDNQKVNAQKYEVFIRDPVDNVTLFEYLFLQDARLILAHLEQREPTTAGTNVVYSGNPNNSLSGTILYTTDGWAAAVAGWTALGIRNRTNNEYPLVTLVVKETAPGGGINIMTFASGAKLQSLEISRPAEGAVKINVVFTIFIDPVVT